MMDEQAIHLRRRCLLDEPAERSSHDRPEKAVEDARNDWDTVGEWRAATSNLLPDVADVRIRNREHFRDVSTGTLARSEREWWVLVDQYSSSRMF